MREMCNICFFWDWLNSLSIIIFICICFSENGSFIFHYAWKNVHCAWMPHFPYSFPYYWTLRFILSLSYSKQCEINTNVQLPFNMVAWVTLSKCWRMDISVSMVDIFLFYFFLITSMLISTVAWLVSIPISST